MSVEVRQEFVLAEATARFRYTSSSDRGAVRRINEDSFLSAAPLFIVADGMGGHAFGDRASQTAIAAFAGDFETDRPANPQQVLETVRRANEAVLSITDGSEFADVISGTTLTGVAFVDIGNENYHWMAFNVGDSRIYSWDGRTLRQVSVDHSAVQELIDLGQITPREAARHPDRNVVTRALGADTDVDPDIWLLPARAHQTFLLCSDGLTKELDDAEIARIIVFHNAEELRESDGLPITLAERLVNAAIAAGGSDNVTVVVVESDIVGAAVAASTDDTVDRNGMPRFLEETRPRG
ncbi:protein phosphatase 2C domain-containing protein [Glaciihabitans sp. UYNi722]|uniref:PP2C family protein-serine/threonine phosphatase n=1 Tax=Glaciihabitans sp. UYNi722 TaxID=3156344 RepID=UPI0033919407